MMSIKRLILFAILPLALFGCGGFIKTSYDEFTQCTTDRIHYNELAGGLLGIGSHVMLNAERITTKDGVSQYFLTAEYRGDRWLFIQPGKSLMLLIDGERFDFVRRSIGRYVISYRLVEESASYDITPELLHKIAYAKKITMRLIGDNTYCERYFKSRNFKLFREFYEKYVKDATEELRKPSTTPNKAEIGKLKAKPEEKPRKPSVTWYEIARWKGKSTKNTETFHIPSHEWRISWSTYGDMNFTICVYRSDGSLVGLAANVIGEDRDSSLMRGTGDYYLAIYTSQPYVVTVEAKR